LADLLRMGRLPEAWIAPPQVRELVRYRAKLVALGSGLKAQVHAVLAKAGVLAPASGLFGIDWPSPAVADRTGGPYTVDLTAAARRPPRRSRCPVGTFRTGRRRATSASR
jgi:hypothetical protein